MNKDGQIVSKVTHPQIKSGGGSSSALDSNVCNLTSDITSTSSGGGDMNLTCLEQSSNELDTLTNAVDSVLSQLVLSSYSGFEVDLQRRQSFENSTSHVIYSSPGALSSRLSSDQCIVFHIPLHNMIQSTPANSYPDNSDLRLIRTCLRLPFREDQSNIIRIIRISPYPCYFIRSQRYKLGGFNCTSLTAFLIMNGCLCKIFAQPQFRWETASNVETL